MAKTMAEVLAEHQRWVSYCGPEQECGCGVRLTENDDAGMAAHQAAALSAAGFGLVADTKAERGWLAKTRNTDGSIAIIGHFKTEAEAEKWAGKYPASFVEPS